MIDRPRVCVTRGPGGQRLAWVPFGSARGQGYTGSNPGLAILKECVMLAIEREHGQELHLIDEVGRRFVIQVKPAGIRKVKVLVTAPPTVAIVRPEMGAIVEAEMVSRARRAAATQGDAA